MPQSHRFQIPIKQAPSVPARQRPSNPRLRKHLFFKLAIQSTGKNECGETATHRGIDPGAIKKERTGIPSFRVYLYLPAGFYLIQITLDDLKADAFLTASNSCCVFAHQINTDGGSDFPSVMVWIEPPTCRRPVGSMPNTSLGYRFASIGVFSAFEKESLIL